MGKKFDVADPTTSGFQIESCPSRCGCRPAKYRGHIVNHRKIEGLAPDEWLKIGKKSRSHIDVTRNRPGTNEGRTFPGAGNGFIISDGGIALDADSRGTGIRTQAQINPPANTIAGGAGQQTHQTAGHINEKGLAFFRLNQCCAVRIMQDNKIDIRGIIQFTCAQLAEGKNGPSTAFFCHMIRMQMPALCGPSQQITHGGRNGSIGGITQPAHLCCHIVAAGQIGKRHRQRAALPQTADGCHHAVIIIGAFGGRLQRLY